MDACGAGAGREILVDARWLEPPEPLEQALAAVDRAAVGERVRLLVHRDPVPLYELLRLRRWRHQTRRLDDGCYEVLIFRDAPP